MSMSSFAAIAENLRGIIILINFWLYGGYHCA